MAVPRGIWGGCWGGGKKMGFAPPAPPCCIPGVATEAAMPELWGFLGGSGKSRAGISSERLGASVSPHGQWGASALFLGVTRASPGGGAVEKRKELANRSSSAGLVRERQEKSLPFPKRLWRAEATRPGTQGQAGAGKTALVGRDPSSCVLH